MDVRRWDGPSPHGRRLRRRSRESRRTPRRNRSLILEDLEGRRLPSQAIPPIATLPTASSYNMIAGADGDLWVAVNPTATTSAIDRIGLDGSVTSFPVPGGTSPYFQIVSLTTGPDGNVWFDADVDRYDPNSLDLTFNPSQVVIGNVTPAGHSHRVPSDPRGRRTARLSRLASDGQRARRRPLVRLFGQRSQAPGPGLHRTGDDRRGRHALPRSPPSVPKRSDWTHSRPEPTGISGSPRAWARIPSSAGCPRVAS